MNKLGLLLLGLVAGGCSVSFTSGGSRYADPYGSRYAGGYSYQDDPGYAEWATRPKPLPKKGPKKLPADDEPAVKKGKPKRAKEDKPPHRTKPKGGDEPGAGRRPTNPKPSRDPRGSSARDPDPRDKPSRNPEPKGRPAREPAPTARPSRNPEPKQPTRKPDAARGRLGRR